MTLLIVRYSGDTNIYHEVKKIETYLGTNPGYLCLKVYFTKGVELVTLDSGDSVQVYD